MRPTVLIADSDELLSAAYGAFLTAEGFQVSCVKNGLDCLEFLRQHAPLSLILDAELPWGSWNGVIEVMNQDPSISIVPVVILTARAAAIPGPIPAHCSPILVLKPIAPLSMARILRNLIFAEPALAQM